MIQAVPALLTVGWPVTNKNVDDMTESAAPQPPASTPSHDTRADDAYLLDRLRDAVRYRFIAASVFVLTTLAIMLQGYTTGQIKVIEPDAKAGHAVSDALLQQEKEPPVSSNSRADNVGFAKAPRSPLPPAGRRTWLLSVAIGLALAVGVAFGLDYMNDTIKTPEDVSLRFKQPFLGLVPSVRGDTHPLLAVVARAARLRRVVSRAADLAARQVQRRGHEDHHRHQRTAARRQDDHRGQHRDGAGVWWRAGAADRRRHAPSWPAPPPAAHQRSGSVAGAQSVRRACATCSSAPLIRTCSR